MTAAADRTQVVVVGAGPVGLASALACHGNGLRTMILEAENEQRVRPGSRAIFLHKDPIRLIESYAPGVADRIYDNSLLWTRNRYTYRGRTFFNREYRRTTAASRDYGASQSQKLTEGIFMDALRDRGVPIRWSSAVERVSTEPDGVTLTLAGGEQIQADFVIGADGARSEVRKSLGIEMEGTSGSGAFNVIVDVEELPDRPTPIELHFHYQHPKLGFRNLLQIPMKDAWRLGLTLKPGDDVARLSSREGVQEWLSQVMDPRYASRISWISTYRYHQLVARRFTDENRRVLLVGEAAHLFAPWGGRGLNSGIVDACSAADAIRDALRALDLATAHAIVDAFDEDRRDAGHFNKRCAEYALNLLSPSTLRGRIRRRVLGLLAPHVRKAAIVLATGPNGGFPGGRPGKGVY